MSSKLSTWLHEGSSIVALAGGGAALTSVATGALTPAQAAGGFVFALIGLLMRQTSAAPTTVAGANPVVNAEQAIVGQIETPT